MDESSRGSRDRSVGVVDKSVAVLTALETGPLSLSELVAAMQQPRPTVHRLARALEDHGLLDRDGEGRFRIGPRIAELAAATDADRLPVLARPVLTDLRDATGESAQLYVRRGEQRVCIAGADRTEGLRDTVPVGAVLTLSAGSAAQVLTAWRPDAATGAAAFSARTLAVVRRRGYAHSIAEREPGVASLSAPVRSPAGAVVAAISVSGPVERLGNRDSDRLAPAVLEAARLLSDRLAVTTETAG